MAQFILSGFADEAAPDLNGQITALKRNGMEYMELRNINGKGILDYSDEEIAGFKEVLDQNGIKVSSLGSPIGKYNITDPFEPHFNSFKKAVKAAQILGTKYMRIFSFFIPEGEDCKKYREEVFSRLNAMLDYAEKEGITLCHENEAGIYGRMPEECLDLLENLPRLKGIFDPSNFIKERADIQWGIDHLTPYLEYLHIKDCGLDDMKIVPAGFGDGQVADVIEAISAQRDGLDTFLSVEPHLFAFMGYSNLDDRKLENRFSFANNNESFDAAVNALKDILKNLGYKKGDDNKWKK